MCAVVGWFYGWTAWSTDEPWKREGEKRDYYNRLIDGWLDGQLHMKVKVPEALLKLEDPYDPATRPSGVGLHDASFYRGKYYVYFGAAPVVVLMLPFRVITGTDLPLMAAVWVFVYGGFLASVAVWLAVRRRYFAEASTIVVLAGVLALGMAALGPVLLRRPEMWELPIAAGYCFAMLTLGCVWRSVHAEVEARRRWWLAGAATCLGLAVASRPVYLFATPMLVMPMLCWWRQAGRVPWREFAAAVIPMAAIGAAMAAHNYARFDDPLQFGQAYQLSMDYESKLPHFAARYVPYNVQQHFFGAARGSRYFPFVAPPEFGPAPAGYTAHRGDVYGVLRNMPVAWLALALPLAWWRRSQEERAKLRAWLGSTCVLWVATTGVMLSFFSALARYQVDFVPTLMLLAGVGMLGVERWAGSCGGRAVSVFVKVGLVAAAVWSAGFAALYSLQVDGLLQENNPALRREVARWLNAIPATVERVAGVSHGAVELTVRVAAGGNARDEMLVVCGEGAEADRVFLRYASDGAVRLGFQHAGAPERLSAPLAIEAGRTLGVGVTMGSLYPPATHPFFGDATVEEILARRRRMRIEVEGRPVLEGYYRFGSGGAVRIGREAGGTGAVEGVRGVAMPVALAGGGEDGGDTLRLRVRLPRGRVGTREPLVVTGQTGAGDLLSVEYLSGDVVRVVFDHWGSPGMVGEGVPVDFSREQTLEVSMPSLAVVRDATMERPTRVGRVRVVLNGRVVLEGEGEFYTAEAGEVSVGANPIGGTSCGPRFSGEVLSAERVPR